MKSNYVLRTIAVLAITLSAGLVASAQPGQSAPPPKRASKAAEIEAAPPCRQNIQGCLQRINNQISLMRAYVARLKPGDTVTWNPQPDPPTPDPWLTRASKSFQNLRNEFAELSVTPPDCKTDVCRNVISDAQDKLINLNQPSINISSAKAALSSLSADVQQLSRALGSGRGGMGKRKAAVDF
jgi:hypothetical protein